MATPLRLHPFFLFVIAMNCLSILLNRAAQQGEFGYHHLCEETKLTHLCFADDLLILTEGSTRSIKGVLEVLWNFEAHSGLGISVSKSCFFTSGLSQQEIELLQQEAGLSHGTLPIRYLGVPLCTKKLTMANCEPLILNVKAKLNSWSARSLSFAGRLLLINTVISGITNFWCDTFTLPKFCIKLINSLCGAYSAGIRRPLSSLYGCCSSLQGPSGSLGLQTLCYRAAFQTSVVSGAITGAPTAASLTSWTSAWNPKECYSRRS